MHVYKIFFSSFMITLMTQSVFAAGRGLRQMQRTSVCTSNKCQRTAFILSNSIDPDKDPCVNFYKYACGKFPKSYPLGPNDTSNGWMQMLRIQNELKLRDYLNQPQSDSVPEFVNVLRQLYSQCLDVDGMDRLGYDTFLNSLFVADLPVLPIFRKNLKIDWQEIMAILAVSGSHDFVFNIFVHGDARNQQINTPYVSRITEQPILTTRLTRTVDNSELYKSTGDLPSNSRIMTDREKMEMKFKKKRAFINFVFGAMSLLQNHYQLDNVNLNDPQLRDDVDKLFEFIDEMSQINEDVYLDGKEQTMLTLKNLQKKTDKIMPADNRLNWRKFFNMMFAGYTKTSYDFHDDEFIGIFSLSFIRKMLSLLGKTDSRIIAMAMWYDCLKTFAPVTTKDLRRLYFTYMAESGGYTLPPWDIQCERTILSKYPMAVSYLFTNEQGAKMKKKNAEKMTDFILQIFKKNLKSANWMDSYTRYVASEKISRIRYYVAFPHWLDDHSSINSFHDDLPVPYGDFVSTILMFNLVAKKNNLSKLLMPNDSNNPGFTMYPHEANAAYNANTHSLTLPYAVLHPPCYDYGIESLNFGSLGVVTAHEITHGFDNLGKDYDSFGNLKPWMSKESMKIFRDKAKCFVDFYNNLYISEIGQNVDGQLTLNENIADNGGLSIAYEAYQTYRSTYGDMSLSGFEEFTHDQLFTLGFAMIECSSKTNEMLKLLAKCEHTPSEQRINGMMMNFSEFRRIWDCPNNAPMISKTKCKIW